MDDDLRLLMNYCINRSSHTRKAERSETSIRITKCFAGPICVLDFCFFVFSLRRSDLVDVRRRPKPAEFPLLRKVPLISPVSEILKS